MNSENDVWQISEAGLFQHSKFKDFYLGQLENGQLVGQKNSNQFIKRPRSLGWSFDGFTLTSTDNNRGNLVR